MNRTELIKAVAQEVGMTQKDVKAVLEATQAVAYAEMAKQEEVKLFEGLSLVGVFKEATVARNPMDGSTVNVPEKVVPKAKWGAVAKRVVNGEE